MVPLYLLSTLIPFILTEGSARYIPSMLLLTFSVVKHYKNVLSAHLSREIYLVFTVYASCFILSFFFSYAYANFFYLIVALLNFALFSAMRSNYLLSIRSYSFFTFTIFSSLLVPNLSEGFSYWPSIYANTNACGVVALSSLYFILVLLKIKKQKYLWVLFGISIVVILLTKSRSCQLAAIIFFSLMFLSKFLSKKLFSFFIISFLIVLSFVYIQIINNPDLLLKIEVITQVLNPDKSVNLAERDIVTPIALKGIKDFPMGLGMQQGPEYIGKSLGRPLAPHNVYLGIALEGGILMLVAYVALLFLFIYQTKSRLAASFMAAFAIRCFFDNGMPFAMSLASVLMVLPFFLNEFTIDNKTVEIAKS